MNQTFASPLELVSPLFPLKQEQIAIILVNPNLGTSWSFWHDAIGSAISLMSAQGCVADTLISRYRPIDSEYSYPMNQWIEIDSIDSFKLKHLQMDTDLTLVWDSTKSVTTHPYSVVSLVLDRA